MSSYTTLLVDTDIIAYKVASVNQIDFDWGDGYNSRILHRPRAKEQAVRIIEDLLVTLKADHAIMCLTDKENFRYDVLPSYKGNRKGVEKPEMLQELKDYLAERYESFIRPSLEADDVMGILSTHPTLIKGKKIIVSEDKDMKTIHGWLFNPAKDKKARLVTGEQADRYHMLQTLTGDATDGYKGCPQIGPKKAEVILDAHEPHEWWDAVVRTYEAKGLTEEDALVQARVACICRSVNYDFKTKEVILWSPTHVTV